MISIISAQHSLIVLEDSITLSQIYEYAIFIRSYSYTCGFPPSFIRTELPDNDQSWSNSLRCSTGGDTVFQPSCIEFVCCNNNTTSVRTPQPWGAFVQPLLQWNSNGYHIFWVYVGSLMYPACNAHAPYFHLWPVRLYSIFPHYLINGMILVFKKMCFYFLYNFCPKHFSFAEDLSEIWWKM
jgi:hypothetical protein